MKIWGIALGFGFAFAATMAVLTSAHAANAVSIPTTERACYKVYTDLYDQYVPAVEEAASKVTAYVPIVRDGKQACVIEITTANSQYIYGFGTVDGISGTPQIENERQAWVTPAPAAPAPVAKPVRKQAKKPH